MYFPVINLHTKKSCSPCFDIFPFIIVTLFWWDHLTNDNFWILFSHLSFDSSAFPLINHINPRLLVCWVWCFFLVLLHMKTEFFLAVVPAGVTCSDGWTFDVFIPSVLYLTPSSLRKWFILLHSQWPKPAAAASGSGCAGTTGLQGHKWAFETWGCLSGWGECPGRQESTSNYHVSGTVFTHMPLLRPCLCSSCNKQTGFFAAELDNK